ncbi:MAG: hypothetical protein LUF29_03585 [Oscillospiraceae bacterium]|nr:hypothetical protein [Oscillospiraceae bacterium]
MAKRLICILISVLMVVSILPTGVIADTSGTALTLSGGSLSSGDYYLDSDITLTSAITIASGATVTIDLNGHTLTGVGGSTWALYVNGGTLTLNDTAGGGKVTTASALTSNGGAVYVTAGGTFTMNGGTISGVTSSKYGTAVYVAGSSANATFIMNGGTISDNSTSNYGGAVYLGALSTFTMNGGTITRNEGKGTVYMTGSASYFTMNGGSITGNTSSYYGGGVCVSAATSTFKMTGGTISNNTATYGGGVYVASGDFQMSGGTISGNTTDSGDGGGVCISGSDTRTGTFTMSGGTISGNTSATYGGGIGYSGRGTVTMSGGVITENKASTYGGGVSVYNSPSKSYTNTFTMTGGAIYDNTATSGAADIYALTGTKNSNTATAVVTLPSSMTTTDGTTYTWYTDANGSRYSEDNATEYSVTDGTAIDTTSEVSLIAVEEETEVVPELYGKSLYIGTQIGVVYYYTLDDSIVDDYASYSVEFTVGGTTQDEKITLSPKVVGSTTYYVATCNVSFYQMAQNIKAQVYYTDSEGTTTAVGEASGGTYTVRQYYVNKYSNVTTTSAIKTLLESMLNFGSYGQAYIGDESTLANADLNISSAIAEVDASHLENYKAVTTNEVESYKVYGSVLISTSDSAKLKFTFSGVSGCTVTVSGNEVTIGEDGTGTYTTEDIYVQNWDSAYTIVISDGDDTTADMTVEFSVLSYAYSMINEYEEYESDTTKTLSSGNTENLRNLLKAMCLYNEAADAYLGTD